MQYQFSITKPDGTPIPVALLERALPENVYTPYARYQTQEVMLAVQGQLRDALKIAQIEAEVAPIPATIRLGDYVHHCVRHAYGVVERISWPSDRPTEDAVIHILTDDGGSLSDGEQYFEWTTAPRAEIGIAYHEARKIYRHHAAAFGASPNSTNKDNLFNAARKLREAYIDLDKSRP